MFWHHWVGLPWQWGADPRDGRAACCFRTAQAARESMGLSWPAGQMEGWYALAEAGAWGMLRGEWNKYTMVAGEPAAGQIVRVDNDNGSFGLAVFVDPATIIAVRHYGRLLVVPARVFSLFSRYELR